MRIWVDDVRPAPEGYVWCKSTNEALRTFRKHFDMGGTVEIIDLDHDAGDYVNDGGDFIRVLHELERLSHRNSFIYPRAGAIANICFRLHSMNPVGVENMRAIIQRNAWKEIR